MCIMKKKALKAAMALAAAIMLLASALVIAGCSCSSQQVSSSSGSASSASSGSMSASDLPMYTVPNVLSLTQADAEKSIVASGLVLGDVKKEASDTVPLGSVISQKPEPLTEAQANSKVDLVISSGKQEPKDVTVPDLTGKSQEEAEKALADVGLVGVAGNPEESTAVAPGLVFKQSVDPGTSVKEHTKVMFVIALAPADVPVPDVTGMTQKVAKEALLGDGLGFDFTTAHSSSVKEGLVISQSIDAGTRVKSGTTVTVNVSLGPKPEKDVKVPDVTTYSWSDAEATLQSAGLKARYTGDPAGLVVSQDVKPGTKVAPGTLVTVKLAGLTPMVKVPNLVGMSVTSAEEATDKANLALDVNSWHGTVVEQWPEAGTEVEARTTVHATIDDSDFRGDGDSGSSIKPQGDSDEKPAEPDNDSQGDASDDSSQPDTPGDSDQPDQSDQPDEPDESSTPNEETQDSPDEGDVPGGDEPDGDADAGDDTEPVDQGKAAAPAATGKTISKDEAKKIALKDSGENEANTTKIDVKLEEGENPAYEVDIVLGDTHHLYKIDAKSGKILSSKITYDDKEDAGSDGSSDASKS